MRRKTGRKCSPNDLSGAHGGAQKTKKRGMLQVDEVARRGSWAILAQKFFKKEGFGAKQYDFHSRGAPKSHRWPLNLRSTPKRAALRAPQGFRASREARDTIRCEE